MLLNSYMQTLITVPFHESGVDYTELSMSPDKHSALNVNAFKIDMTCAFLSNESTGLFND